MSSEPGLHLDVSFDAGHSCAPYQSHTEWHLSGAPCGAHPVLVSNLCMKPTVWKWVADPVGSRHNK